MTLPDLLSDLAALLPERVRFPSGYGYSCLIGGQWVLVTPYGPGRTSDWEAAAALEAVLREECEARGWSWALGQEAGGRPYAAVMPTPAHRPPHYASTPAEALAAAVLAALKI